jgi:hypothetical protein
MNHSLALAVEVALLGTTTVATITDRRADTLGVFESLSEGQRSALAGDAWNVGLRALMNAYRHAEESRLSEMGTSLIGELNTQLEHHAERPRFSRARSKRSRR